MNLSMNCMKLDYLLLKPYLKSMLLVLLVPLLITFFTGTLFEGLSFAATVMAMTTGYTFSVVEKNSMERFYGFLPAKKSALVAGRYLIIFAMGFLALLVTLGVQAVILRFKNTALTLPEILGTFLLCAILFCIYAGVQIPGYYRFGSIKGKMFMVVPTVGFLLFYYIVRLLMGDANSFDLGFLQNSALPLLGGVGAMALVIVLSVTASIQIVQKKRA